MTDLNLWELAYSGETLEFGLHATGHPFTAQPVVSYVDLDTDDLSHPLSDGLTFGVDYTRGMVLSFAGVHLRDEPLPAERKWTDPMDDASSFARVWRGRWLRQAKGRVATLTNVDRGRMAYGRPRGHELDYAKARHGWLPWAAGFVAVDDKFYAADEQVAVMGVDPGEAAVFAFPVTFPYSAVEPSETRTWVTNAGDEDAWPIVTFRQGGHPRLEFLNDAGGVEWSLEVNDNLAVDQEVVVDLRPWVRTVKLNGTDASGLLRGSRMDQARITPGTHELKLVAVDPSGLAEVEVRWRDAYASL